MSQISQENTWVGVSFEDNFIKKRFQHRFFPVKFAKIFKNTLIDRISPVLVTAAGLEPTTT